MPALSLAATGDPKYLELGVARMLRIDPTIWIAKLTPRVWLHTTTYDLGGGGYYPANGLIVETDRDVVLIDTGWTPAQTRTLLEHWQRTRRPVTAAFATHFHMDRLGGVDVLQARGIPIYGNPLTIGLAVEIGRTPPKPLDGVEKAATTFAGIEFFYPGQGHTIDNTVVYVPGDNVLFGGCLIKSITSTGLGNIDDAVVAQWEPTVRRLAQRYPNVTPIPGHGTLAGDTVAHTIALAKAGKA